MVRGKIVIAMLASAVLLAGCSPQTTEPDPSPPPTESSPPPTETAPDSEAIRDVDFGSLNWVWDTLGVQFPVQLTGEVTTAEDQYYNQPATFTLGEATFSDANGDGLLDAAVPVLWEAGNGITENWFIWLAQADAPEAPQQIPYPIASADRCGDSVKNVEAIDGGFRVNEVMRNSFESSGACAEKGTMERSRDIVVVGDGSGDGSWPATADGEGWGGYCPVKVYTEGDLAPAQGVLGPSDAAPKTAATGEKLFSPLQHYPFAQPAGWMLTGFLPDDQVDDSVVCVWVHTP